MDLFPLHIFFMVTALVAMAAGISAARFFRGKKWWLKVHKALNLIAASALVFGFATAFIMVQTSGGPHFRVPHTYLGAATILLAICMPFLGFALLKSGGKDKGKIEGLRRTHRSMGRIDILLLAVTVFSGLVLIGLF